MSQPTNLVYNPPFPFGFPYYPPEPYTTGDLLFGYDNNPDFPDLFWWTITQENGLTTWAFFGHEPSAREFFRDVQRQFPYLTLTLSAGQPPQDMIPTP